MNLNDSSKIAGLSTEFGTDIGDIVEGAGFLIRLLARVIDLIAHYVVAFIAVVLIALVAGIVAAIMGISPDLVAARLRSQTLLGYAFAVLGSTAYHTVCEGMHGSTLGKLICGLVVVKEDGTHCGLLAAFERSLAILIDGLILGAPAAISMSDTSKRQRLGDRWAKTMVVKRPDLEGIMQLRSGLRFVIVFLGGVLLDGAIFGFAQLLKLAR